MFAVIGTAIGTLHKLFIKRKQLGFKNIYEI